MPGPTPDPDATLEAATGLLGDARWSDAAAAYTALAASAGDPRAWEGLATAAWWLDDGVRCLDSREAAYRARRDAGDDLGAALAAAHLGYDAALFGQGAAVARGWLGRARSLLEPLPESGPHGWLAVREAELALNVGHDGTTDPAALRAARRAAGLGRSHGDADLVVVADALCGLALVQRGEVSAGMVLLEGAAVGALAGDVADPMWAGKIWCWLITACEQTHDHERAAQWCDRVDERGRGRDLAPLVSACRVRRAALHIASGAWRTAEDELLDVLERMRGSRRATRLDAVVLLGDLRRHQGRLDEADELFAQAEFDPRAVMGRALVRLARGDAAGAWVVASELLSSISTEEVMLRAGLLLPAVTAAAAAGAIDAARRSADELGHAAASLGSETLAGLASAAQATVLPPGASVSHWRAAVRHLTAAGLTYDAADARLQLARALAEGGQTETAREQVAAAAVDFARLGADARARESSDLAAELDRGADRPAGPLSPRERQVLRLVAKGHTTGAVAQELVISEHTVHRHVSNILAKLEVSSRAAATAAASAAGWI